MAGTWQFEFAGRVVQQIALPRHPLEPHPQRNQPCMLRRKPERFAVLLAVVEHIPLIAFEHRARDIDRFRDAALPTPLQKEADMHAPSFHRVLRVVFHAQIF